MVGQKFITLLANHPWFEVRCVAASARSAGRSYAEAVAGRWAMAEPVPESVGRLPVYDAARVEQVAAEIEFVFCAVDMPKDEVRRLEDAYAAREVPVVSANSAHRWTPDVPMVIPEVNPGHLAVIEAQRRRLRTRRGFVAVKPNCSIQPYVPTLDALMDCGPREVSVCTYQAISGAGKTFATWPEMVDNVIPFIAGEEDKSIREPLKIWGRVENGAIVPADSPRISAQCVRVPVTDGHMAAVGVRFERPPARDEILARWAAYEGRPQKLNLPSAPKPFLVYFDAEDRPQTRTERDLGKGMAVAVGRLRQDSLYHYRFVALSHNTVRGAAGGAVLTAELLKAEGYL